MTRLVKSCLTLANTSVGRLPESDHGEKSPSWHRQDPREQAMQPRQLRRASPNQMREDGDGRKDPAVLDDLEACPAGEREVFGGRPIARVLGLTRGADERAPQQEVDARLQMREV